MVEFFYQPAVLIHHREGLGDRVIGEPQAAGSQPEGAAAHGGREDFGQDHPHDRADGQAEAGDVEHNEAEHGIAGGGGIGEGLGHDAHGDEAEHHAGGAEEHEWFAAPFVDGGDGDEGEEDAGAADDRLGQHAGIDAGFVAHVVEDGGAEIHENIDAGDLLEDGQGNAEDQRDFETPRKQIAPRGGFVHQRVADGRGFRRPERRAADFGQNRTRLVIAFLFDQPTRAFRDEEQQQGEKHRRQGA